MDVDVGDVSISYEIHGTQGPWLILIHSLGCSKAMWAPQVDALRDRYRVLCYDLRGHGNSTVDSTPGSLEVLRDDLIGLMDALGIECSHIAGISIGGMIAQMVAIQRPERAGHLVLANTSAIADPARLPAWQERIERARRDGVSALTQPTLERWFTEYFRCNEEIIVARIARQFSNTTFEGYRFCCEAIVGLNTLPDLPRIRSQALIVGGTEDSGSPVSALRKLETGIVNGQLIMIDGAGHLSSVDSSAAFNDAVTTFFEHIA